VKWSNESRQRRLRDNANVDEWTPADPTVDDPRDPHAGNFFVNEDRR